MRRNKNDRHVDLRRRELPLEIETALPGQSHVQHEASGTVRAPGLQKFRQRRERPDVQTNRSQQAAQRLSNIRIVVDDEDTGLWLRHRSARRSRQALPAVTSPNRPAPGCAFLILAARRRRPMPGYNAPWPKDTQPHTRESALAWQLSATLSRDAG